MHESGRKKNLWMLLESFIAMLVFQTNQYMYMDWSSLFGLLCVFSSLFFFHFVAFLRSRRCRRRRHRHFVITSPFLLCMVIFINTFQLFAFFTFDALKGYALGSERRHFIFAARFNRNTPKIVRDRFREFWEPLESRTKHTRTLRCSAQSQLTWGFSLVHSTSFCFWILVLVIYNLFECNNFQFPFEFAEDFLDFLWWQTPSAAHNFNAILKMKNASLGSLIKLM